MFFKISPKNQQGIEVDTAVADLQTWDERFGHVNVKKINNMVKYKIFDGIKISKVYDFVCELFH